MIRLFVLILSLFMIPGLTTVFSEPLAAFEETIIVPLTEGAYVSYYDQGKQMGLEDPNNLWVGGGSGIVYMYFTYLKFDLSGLDIEQYSQVLLNVHTIDGGGEIFVYALEDDSWSADTITWQNMAPLFPYNLPFYSCIGSFNSSSAICGVADLTEYFQLNSNKKTFSFALRHKGMGRAAFSKDITLTINSFTAAPTPTPDISWYSGQESQMSFSIGSADQLAGLAQLVSRQGLDFSEKTIDLSADIDLSAYGASYRNGRGWMPIGNSLSEDVRLGVPFRGIFNGNNHLITGLYNNNGGPGYDGLYNVGLFGEVEGGSVNDLRVEGVNIQGQVEYVGGVMGRLSAGGSAQNCHVTGSVGGDWFVGGVVGAVLSGSTVENCHSEGTVSGAYYVGGVAGYLYSGSQIANSHSVSAVGNGSGTYCGGVAGVVHGSMEKCFASGAVSGREFLGGVTGLVGGSMTDCYALGAVIGQANKSFYIGGVSGDASGSVTNCYSTSELYGANYVGGIAGRIIGKDYGAAYNGSIINSVALTPRADKRIVAYNSNNGYLSGNRALSNMMNLAGTTLIGAYGTSNGEDVSLDTALTAKFWIDTMGWDEQIWCFADGSLPLLRIPQQDIEPIASNCISGIINSYNPRNPINITLYKAGSATVAGSIVLEGAASGNGQDSKTFTLEGIPQGQYDLEIIKCGHLRYKVIGIIVDDESSGLSANATKAHSSISLTAGDINGDGFINAEDLTCLLSCFNRAPLHHPYADIDGNGIVNAVDLTYLLAGFNKGDVVVPW